MAAGLPAVRERLTARAPYLPGCRTFVRVLAIADEVPRADPKDLVRRNRPDLVLTLGDLPGWWMELLSLTKVPVLGVLGNHDEDYDLETFGFDDLHLRRSEAGGLSFSGFEGCVEFHRHRKLQYTQKQARKLARKLPPASVLVTHCPPYGINDNPDDPAHIGFIALRDWVTDNEPRYLLHGHTTPDPRTRVHRLGPTKVVWVRGAAVLDLDGA
jgi:uncharacterized protein